MIPFQTVNRATLAVLTRLLPGGKVLGNEYVASAGVHIASNSRCRRIARRDPSCRFQQPPHPCRWFIPNGTSHRRRGPTAMQAAKRFSVFPASTRMASTSNSYRSPSGVSLRAGSGGAGRASPRGVQSVFAAAREPSAIFPKSGCVTSPGAG